MRYPLYITLQDGTQWVSYSSFDGDSFFIPLAYYGRDYQTREDAEVVANLTDFDGNIVSAQDKHGEELTSEELQYALGVPL